MYVLVDVKIVLQLLVQEYLFTLTNFETLKTQSSGTSRGTEAVACRAV
jgi:hypothetical protein